MKTLFSIILTSIICTQSVFSQETDFTFTPKGLTDYVVVNCDSASQSKLYQKTLEWVAITYKNPKEVLKYQSENEYIRIEGSSSDMYCINSLGTKTCFNTLYVVEISFKDGKYKFDVISLQSYSSQLGWYEVPIDEKSEDAYYNKKGELKATYKYMDEIPNQFNILNGSLKGHVLGLNDTKKGDW
jgi:hypothetical protein